MESPSYQDPTRRHDFVLIFEVTDGNPNGDPDAGNLPRVDPETMQGLVTDVCLKRKVRDWVDATKGDEANFKIYVQNKGIALNALHQRAYDDLDIKSTGTKQKRRDVDKTRAWMCRNFYDIRTFGAVMTTEVNCGQVRGPVQLTFARSVDPIIPLDLSITRVAITQAAGCGLCGNRKRHGRRQSHRNGPQGHGALWPLRGLRLRQSPLRRADRLLQRMTWPSSGKP